MQEVISSFLAITHNSSSYLFQPNLNKTLMIEAEVLLPSTGTPTMISVAAKAIGADYSRD